MADTLKAHTGEKDDPKARDAAGVANPRDNERLKHTAELRRGERGTRTTRDDTHDLGVPMLQGDPSEPQGPEDAFGPGPKRGDYSERTGGVHSFQAVPVDEYEDDDPYVRDADGNIVDYKPRSVMVAQVPRASERGEEKGLKGGVDTVDAR